MACDCGGDHSTTGIFAHSVYRSMGTRSAADARVASGVRMVLIPALVSALDDTDRLGRPVLVALGWPGNLHLGAHRGHARGAGGLVETIRNRV